MVRGGCLTCLFGDRRDLKDSQSGVGDALAGDVPLNLGLVDPIDTGPDEGPTNAYGPESVSPQRVWVKAGSTVKTHHGQRQTDGKR